jgi:hypothetical protein
VGIAELTFVARFEKEVPVLWMGDVVGTWGELSARLIPFAGNMDFFLLRGVHA